FQPELTQAFLPFLKETLGISSLFESHDDIIRVPHDYDVASSAVLSPVLGPKVESVMQVHVREQRRYHCSLWSTTSSSGRPLPRRCHRRHSQSSGTQNGKR